jgi:signal transduction histidine kinase
MEPKGVPAVADRSRAARPGTLDEMTAPTGSDQTASTARRPVGPGTGRAARAPLGAVDAGDRRRSSSSRGWRGVQSVVDAIPEAVLVVSDGGRLELTNAAADRLFAPRPVTDRDDLLARFEPVVVDLPEALPDRERAEARGDAVIVRQRHRPNRWFALRTVPLDDPGESGAATAVASDDEPATMPLAFILRDVTDTNDLRPLRDAFLGLVSHELRTPITTIYAGSTVLAREPSLSMPATRTLARDVSAEAARLYDVVEDLLALGRIERGVLDPLDGPVEVGPAIDAAIRVATSRHPAARIRRHGPRQAPRVRGDATYLDQAVRDLLLAVLRRPGQPADARIELRVQVDRARAEVRIAIDDRGPNVGEADRDTAFELAQLSAPAHPLGGIGPFVAAQLIEAMGGRVWAKDGADGEGFEVGLALPLA